MFKEFSIHLIMILIIFGSAQKSLYSQDIDSSKIALKERALERFESGEFVLALADYKILMDKFPRDPMYKYYTGVCLVELNQKFEDAIELLHFSSSRGVPPDVNYYLGEAYRKNYDFPKAKQYYLTFDKEAPRSMAREKNSKLLIRSVQTAMGITSSYNPFEVINVTSINLYDPAQFEQIRMKGGRLQVKPDVFFAEGEQRGDFNELMFLPENVARGEFVYFTSYERGGKRGSQIFQARKGNAGKWSDIRPVDGINSEMDEILPYFDPVGKDLYFASNGFEGIGGFDLYRSHYNEEDKDWSQPINLGFPINSAFDDYLLLPGRDLGMVMFFTGRSGGDSATTVYRVHFSEPKISLASESPEEIRRISNLGGRAAEALVEIESVPQQKIKVPVELSDKQVTTTPIILSRNGHVDESIRADTDYQQMVATALHHQAISDSLTELSTTARIKVRESEDPNDRWIYQKQIMVWEKRAATEQDMADGIYLKIADYQKRETPGIPASIVKEKEVNQITVYKYTDTSIENNENTGGVKSEKATSVEALLPADPSVRSKTVALEKIDDNRVDMVANIKEEQEPHLLNEFEILAASPYSFKDHIPVNQELPKGSYYRIQVGAFSRAVAPDAFGGLSPVTGDTFPERNLTKYYVGRFSRHSDAVAALSKVRSSGFEKAYIVSWYNGNLMTLDKVRKLEK